MRLCSVRPADEAPAEPNQFGEALGVTELGHPGDQNLRCAGGSTQSMLGWITSAQMNMSAQTRRLLEVDTPQLGLRGRALASIGAHQSALPAPSAPVASHPGCQVSPGWSASQSTRRPAPAGAAAVSPCPDRRPSATRPIFCKAAPRVTARSSARSLPQPGLGTVAAAPLCRGRPTMRQLRSRSAGRFQQRRRGHEVRPPNNTSSDPRRYPLALGLAPGADRVPAMDELTHAALQRIEETRARVRRHVWPSCPSC